MRSRLKELEKQVQEQQLTPNSAPAVTSDIDTLFATCHAAVASNKSKISHAAPQRLPDLDPHPCQRDLGNSFSSQARIFPGDWSGINAQQMPILDYGDLSFTPCLMEDMPGNSHSRPNGKFPESWQGQCEQALDSSDAEPLSDHRIQEPNAQGSVSEHSHPRKPRKTRMSEIFLQPSPAVSHENIDRADGHDHANSAALVPPGKDATLEEKTEFVFHCIGRAGFDSMESFVTTFYSSNFNDASSLASEQRMSRSRGFSLQYTASIMQDADSQIGGVQLIQQKILQDSVCPIADPPSEWKSTDHVLAASFIGVADIFDIEQHDPKQIWRSKYHDYLSVALDLLRSR